MIQYGNTCGTVSHCVESLMFCVKTQMVQCKKLVGRGLNPDKLWCGNPETMFGNPEAMFGNPGVQCGNPGGRVYGMLH